MRLLDKYILYSSVFALFTEAFFFNYIIDLKLYYVILISNFLVLSINNKITIHKNLLIMIAFLGVHGALSYLIIKNPIQSLIAQIIGITISSVYYHNLIKIYKVKRLFILYLNLAFYISIISLFMFFLDINIFSKHRLNGIMSEPAHYAAIMIPAAYCFFKKKNYKRLSVVLLTILLSKSFIGFLGLGLMITIPLIKIKYLLKYSWLVALLLITGSYYILSQWNDPVHETDSNQVVRKIKETKKSFNAIYTGKFEKYTNLSSYAFLSNAYIAKEIFKDKPLGTGLGSYKYEYEKYYLNMKPPPYLIELKHSKINKTDANSLFIRMVADLGVFTFLIICYFLYRGVKIFRNEVYVYQQSVFFYLILKLIREGHYFPPEFYFFLLTFLKEPDEDIAYS